MLYIWPCTVPELPPQRLTSSRMIEASARPRPDPPYSSGIIADSQPASVNAATNSSGKPLASSILRQYSAGNSAQRARTPSRMALYSSFRFGFITAPRFLSLCWRAWDGCRSTTTKLHAALKNDVSVEFHFGLLGDAIGIAGPQFCLAGSDD